MGGVWCVVSMCCIYCSIVVGVGRKHTHSTTSNVYQYHLSTMENIEKKPIRIDLELVDANPEGLRVIQTKLNQWLTAGTLVKFESQPMGTQILFTIARRKE